MCLRCMSRSSDGEHKFNIQDPYLTGLFSISILCALWDENRKGKLEVEFVLVEISVVIDEM